MNNRGRENWGEIERPRERKRERARETQRGKEESYRIKVTQREKREIEEK